MDNLRKEIRNCTEAPSSIVDSRLYFKVLCGEIGWTVPSLSILKKDISKNYCSVALNRMVNSMELFLSEPQVMYHRVACIPLETYGDLAPMVIKQWFNP